jgi:hypothetical protein
MTVTTPFIEGFLSPGPAEQIHEHISILCHDIQSFMVKLADKRTGTQGNIQVSPALRKQAASVWVHARN